jgi:hypothetical protein
MEDVARDDTEVRLALYRLFVDSGRAPSASALAAHLGAPMDEVRTALERLAAAKAVVLQPESREILIAAPLCAVPTPYLVHGGGRQYFGTCAWDALAIPAMLEADGRVETSCACCGEGMYIEIRKGAAEGSGVIHFALPARQWWQDIVFT